MIPPISAAMSLKKYDGLKNLIQYAKTMATQNIPTIMAP